MALLVLRGIIELLNRARTNQCPGFHPAERDGKHTRANAHAHTLKHGLLVVLWDRYRPTAPPTGAVHNHKTQRFFSVNLFVVINTRENCCLHFLSQSER